MCVYVCLCLCVCMCVNVCMYICVYMCMYVCMRDLVRCAVCDSELYAICGVVLCGELYVCVRYVYVRCMSRCV